LHHVSSLCLLPLLQDRGFPEADTDGRPEIVADRLTAICYSYLHVVLLAQ